MGGFSISGGQSPMFGNATGAGNSRNNITNRMIFDFVGFKNSILILFSLL